jgi:predicted membrane metal-binding protein
VLCAFLLGVGAGTIYHLPLATITWFFLVAGGLAALCLKDRLSWRSHYFFGTICLLAFSLGLLRMEVASWWVGVSPLEAAVGEEIETTGMVIAEPDVRESTQHLKVRISDDTILVTTDRFQTISYGDEVTVRGELKMPEPFATDLGRDFHYEHYLLAQGIEYLVQFAEVSVVSSGHGHWWLTYLLKAKQLLLTAIGSVIGEPQAGLGAGLLLGVKQALGDELEQTFARLDSFIL